MMLKFTLILCLGLFSYAVARPDFCAGCIEKINGNEEQFKDAEKELNASLDKLAAGDGPTYKLGKVNSASRQVVSGLKYYINADLIDGNKETKTCDIELWQQPWLPNGIKVTFQCPGENEVVRKHSA